MLTKAICAILNIAPRPRNTFADVYKQIGVGRMVRRQGWLQFNVIGLDGDNKPTLDWSIRFIAKIRDDGGNGSSIRQRSVSSFSWPHTNHFGTLDLEDAAANDWVVIGWPETKMIANLECARGEALDKIIDEAVEAANVK